MSKENIFPNPLARIMRGVEFHEFLKREDLKTWSFKGQQSWLPYSWKGIALLLERRQTTTWGQTVWKQQSEKCLGHDGVTLFPLFRVHPERRHSLRRLSGNKGTGQYHFDALHLSIGTGPYAGTSAAPILPTSHAYTKLPNSGGTTVPSDAYLSPNVLGPAPWRVAQIPAQTMPSNTGV